MAYFEFKTNPLYVQGPDALLELKRYCYNLGQNFLIVTGCGPITDLVTQKVKKSFDNTMASNVQPGNLGLMGAKAQAERFDKENKKITYSFYDFEGKEVTLENVAKIADIVKEKNIDVIIGIGGGKAMDVVRGVHHATGCKVVLCPTAIATNAPATALHVNYTENGEVVGLMKMDLWPSVVLVDLSIVITAPVVTLAAGMGDCMATYYESLEFNKILNRQEQLVDMVWKHMEDLKETFFENGYKAVLAAKKGIINPAYESVVAQIAHMSGATSVSMGAHFSHIVDELLLCLEPTKKKLHGILVGYGVIPFMVWKNRPIEEIYEYIDFAKSIGIPVTFKELGIENIPMEELKKAAEYAVVSATAKISLAKLSPEDLYRNMLVADQIVKDYLGCE